MGVQLTDSSKTDEVLSIFGDKESISEYARIYVATAVELKLIQGSNDNGILMFRPLDNTNRAEAAVVIYRMI